MGDQDYEDGDITEGGDRIIVGKERTGEWTAPESYAENCELIEEHLEPVFGEAPNVMHEIISDLVHLDVLVYPPNDTRDFWVYVTSGMSDLRMSVPPDLDPKDLGRSELMIALPREWGDAIRDMDAQSDDADLIYWPIGFMKWLARYPHEASVWFADGHTIPNGAEMEPFVPGSGLTGAFLTYSTLLPDDRLRLLLPDGDYLNFYGIILLHTDEMNFKLKKGADSLLEKFQSAGVNEVVDLKRPSVIRSNILSRFFGGH